MGRDGLLAGKGQQLAGKVRGAAGGLLDFLKIDMNGLGWVQLLHGQLDVAKDHAQHVVEVVGHATRQPADGFHFLGLVKLAFELGLLLLSLLALGNV